MFSTSALQKRVNQQRAADLLVEQLLRAVKFALQKGIEFVGVGKLLAEVRFGALQFAARRSSSGARLLVDQFLKDDHLQGAIANLRRQIFGNAVVLAGVGKDRVFLAQQIGIGEDGTIDTRNRLAELFDGERRLCAGVCRNTVGAWEATWL